MTSVDVAIVGAGPAGVSAAWPLARAGFRIALLDAGPERPRVDGPMSLEELNRDPDQWRHRLGGDLRGLGSARQVSPKLATPLAMAVTNGASQALGIISEGVALVVGRGAGGLSAIWGGGAVTMEAGDMTGWPISLSDLRPHYEAVAARIGISGHADEALAGFAGASLPLDFPLPPCPPVAHLLANAAQARKGGFAIGRALNAVITRDRPGRAACTRCGLCLWGCPRKSIYDAGDEIPALVEFPNLAWRPATLVEALRPADGGWELVVAGGERLRARRVVLAGGTLSSTRLVLAAYGATGQRVRLQTNPVAAAAFVVPRLLLRKGDPNSFALGQAGWRLDIGEGDYATGVFYGADALPLSAMAERMFFSRPFALRTASFLTGSLVVSNSYLDGRYSDTWIRLEDDGRLQVGGSLPEAASARLLEINGRVAAALRPMGGWYLPGSFAVAAPCADVHYASTMPMGGCATFATDAFGSSASLPGLYVVDGSILPSLPPKHLTLTVMANAHRIASALAEEGLST